MKRHCAWVLWALLGVVGAGHAAGATPAAETEYTRGEFRFFVGPPRDFVVARAIPAQWTPSAPGADDKVWRYWLFDAQVDRRKGADHEFVEYAYEARTSAHVGDAGRFQIEFNPGYQRLVLHRVELRRDGAWLNRLLPDKISLARRESAFEQDMADGQVTALIVLDDVRVGDVVRIAYTVTGRNPILAGQARDASFLAWRNPALEMHYRVLYDPGTQPRVYRANGAPAPVVRSQPDRVEVSVDVGAVAAVTDEQSYPAWYRPYPQLQVGPARTWGDVVAWALPLFPKVDALPADLEARIAEWKRLPDPAARLAAALRAVQDEVRYFGVEIGDSTHRPANPAETWQRRWGDCKDKTYLLVTLLARLDIPAVPALVSTQRARALSDELPTAAAFNHVIVRATLDGTPLWVDPTRTQEGGDPRDVDLTDYGVALPVVAGVKALETIVPVRAPRSGVTTVERFAPVDGGVQLQVETTYAGASADQARVVVSHSRNDEIERRSADYYRKRYGALDIAVAPTVRDDRARNVLVIGESYVLKSPWAADAGAARALDVHGQALDEASTLPNAMHRTGPLAVGTPATYRHEARFALPQGWRAANDKESQRLSSDAFDYTRAVDVGDKEVAVVNELRVTRRELTATQADAHLGELRRMRDTLGTRLRFQAPPSRLESQERDARLKALLRDVMDTEGTQ